MKTAYRQEQVINGTYGEAWFGSEYLATLTKASAKLAISYEDVTTPRKLTKGKKMVGLEGTGEVEIEKVTSVGARFMNDQLMNGKQPVVDIMMKLDDPDAIGAERVMLKSCTFNELGLIDFEAGATGKENFSFNFESWEFYDLIED